jgi:outer membrane protein TolC
MAAEDGIRQAVRRDLRQLETERLNFEIARASLVTAARQVEQTRERILTEARPDNTNYTQDVLNALNALLQAQNTLIASWVNYEAGRAQLLLDLDVLQLDERGVPIDERNRGTDQSDPGARPGAGCPPE